MNSVPLAPLFLSFPSSPEAFIPSDLDLPVLFMCLITLYCLASFAKKGFSWYRKVCMKATLLTWSCACTGSGPIFSVPLGPFVERVTPFICCQINPATLALKLGILLTSVAKNLSSEDFYSCIC